MFRFPPFRHASEGWRDGCGVVMPGEWKTSFVTTCKKTKRKWSGGGAAAVRRRCGGGAAAVRRRLLVFTPNPDKPEPKRQIHPSAVRAIQTDLRSGGAFVPP